MSATTRNLLVLVLGIVMGFSLAVGRGVFAERDPSLSVLPLEELRTFTSVFSRIKSDYVEDIDDEELIEHAIRGMLSNLDPHSAYLDADEYQDLRAGTEGKFGGLGIEVSMDEGFVKVVAPIDDTPAQRAGIQAGDLIIRLDENPVKGMSLSEAVRKMRGDPGTEINLTIMRDGEDRPIQVTVERDIIQVQSTRARTLEPGFGYVRVTQFQSRTRDSLIEDVEKLKEENGGSLKGMILDLRNNPGGVLNAAVDVADAFLNDGKIVYTDGRVEDSRVEFSAEDGDVLDGAKLVVLVNSGSASASEIVAGALQDHGRAVVMGSKTFGKGSVQTIVPLGNGGAVKLTTARYYTPTGRSIQAEGILPDIELESLEVAATEDTGIDRVTEIDLSRHLDGERDIDTPAPTRVDPQLAREDFELYQALNLLKGIHLVEGRGR